MKDTSSFLHTEVVNYHDVKTNPSTPEKKEKRSKKHKSKPSRDSSESGEESDGSSKRRRFNLFSKKPTKVTEKVIQEAPSKEGQLSLCETVIKDMKDSQNFLQTEIEHYHDAKPIISLVESEHKTESEEEEEDKKIKISCFGKKGKKPESPKYELTETLEKTLKDTGDFINTEVINYQDAKPITTSALVQHPKTEPEIKEDKNAKITCFGKKNKKQDSPKYEPSESLEKTLKDTGDFLNTEVVNFHDVKPIVKSKLEKSEEEATNDESEKKAGLFTFMAKKPKQEKPEFEEIAQEEKVKKEVTFDDTTTLIKDIALTNDFLTTEKHKYEDSEYVPKMKQDRILVTTAVFESPEDLIKVTETEAEMEIEEVSQSEIPSQIITEVVKQQSKPEKKKKKGILGKIFKSKDEETGEMKQDVIPPMEEVVLDFEKDGVVLVKEPALEIESEQAEVKSKKKSKGFIEKLTHKFSKPEAPEFDVIEKTTEDITQSVTDDVTFKLESAKESSKETAMKTEELTKSVTEDVKKEIREEIVTTKIETTKPVHEFEKKVDGAKDFISGLIVKTETVVQDARDETVDNIANGGRSLKKVETVTQETQEVIKTKTVEITEIPISAVDIPNIDELIQGKIEVTNDITKETGSKMSIIKSEIRTDISEGVDKYNMTANDLEDLVHGLPKSSGVYTQEVRTAIQTTHDGADGPVITLQTEIRKVDCPDIFKDAKETVETFTQEIRPATKEEEMAEDSEFVPAEDTDESETEVKVTEEVEQQPETKGKEKKGFLGKISTKLGGKPSKQPKTEEKESSKDKKKSKGIFGKIGDKFTAAKETVSDTAKDTANVVTDKVEETKTSVSDTVRKGKDKTEDKVTAASTAIARKSKEAHDAVKEKSSEAKESVGYALQKSKETVTETTKDIAKKAEDKAIKAKDATSDTIKRTKEIVEDKTTTAAVSVQDATKDIADKTKDQTSKLKDSAADIFQKCKDIVHDTVTTAEDIAADIADTTRDGAIKMKDSGTETIKKSQEIVGEKLSSASTTVKDTTIHIADKTADKAVELKDSAKDVFGKVKDAGAETVKKSQEIVGEKLSTATTTIKDTAQDIKDKTTDKVIGFKESAVDTYETSKENIDEKISSIKDTTKDNLDKSKVETIKAKDSTVGSLVKIKDTVEDISSSVIASVEDASKDIVDKRKDKIIKAQDYISDSTKDIADKTEDIAFKIKDSALDSTKEIIDKSKVEITKIKDASADKLKEAKEAATEEISDKTIKLKDSAKIGQDLVEEKVTIIKDDMKEFAEKSKEVFVDKVSSAVTTISESKDYALDALKSTKETADDKAISIVDATKEFGAKSNDEVCIAAAQTKEFLDKSKKDVSETKDYAEHKFVSAKDGTKSFIDHELASLANSASKGKEVIVEKVEDVKEDINEIIDEKKEDLSKGKDSVFGFFKKGKSKSKDIRDDVKETAIKTKDTVVAGAKQGKEQTKKYVDQKKEEAGKSKDSVFAFFKKGKSKTKEMADDIKEDIIGATDAVKDKIGDIQESAKDEIQKSKDSAAKDAEEKKDELTEATDSSIDVLTGEIDTVVSAVKEMVGKTKDESVKIKEDFSDESKKTIDSAKKIAEDTGKEAGKAKDSVFGFFKKSKDKAKDLVEDGAIAVTDAEQTIHDETKDAGVALKKSADELSKSGKETINDFIEEKKKDATQKKDTLVKDAGDLKDETVTKAVSFGEEIISDSKTEIKLIKDSAIDSLVYGEEKVDLVVVNGKSVVKDAKDDIVDVKDSFAKTVVDGKTSADVKLIETKEQLKDVRETVIDGAKDSLSQRKDEALKAKDKVVDALKETKEKTISSVDDASKDISGKINDEGVNVKEVVVDEAKVLKESMDEKKKDIGKTKDSVFGFFKKGKDKTKDALEEGKNELIEGKDAAIDAGKKGKDASKKFVEEKKDSVFGFFKKGKDATKEFVEEMKDSAVQAKDTVTEKTKKGADSLGEKIISAKEDTKEVAEKSKDAVVDSVKKGKESFEVQADSLGEKITSIKDDTKEVAEKSKDAVFDSVKKGKESLELKVDSAIESTKDEGAKTIDFVVDKFDDGKNTVKDIAGKTQEKLVEGKVKAVDATTEGKELAQQKIESVIKSAKDSTDEIIGKAVDKVSTGKDNLVDGLSKTQEKATEKVESVQEEATKLGHTVIDAAKDLKGSMTETVQEKKKDTGKVKDSVFGFFKKGKDKSKEIVEETKEETKKMQDSSKKAIEEKKEEVAKAKDSVFGFLKKGKDATKDFAEEKKKDAEGIIEDAKKEASNIKTSVVESVIDSKTILEHKIDDKIESGKDTLKAFTENAKDQIVKGKDIVADKAEESKEAAERKITSAKDDLLEIAKKSVEDAKGAIDEKVEAVKDGAIETKTSVVETLKDTESKIETKLGAIKDDTVKSKDIVVEGLKDVNDQLKQKMEVAKDYVEETSQEKKKEAGKAKDSVFGFFKKGKDKTKEIVDEAKEEISKGKENIVDAGKKSKEASKKIVEEKKEDAVRVKDSVFGFFKKGKDATKDFVEEKTEDATKVKDSLAQEIHTEKEKLIDFIEAEKRKAAVDEKVESVKDSLEDTHKESIKIKDDTLERIEKSKEEIITTAKDELHEISGKTKTALSDAIQSGEDIKAEMKDKFQDTEDAIKGKAESIKDGAIETKADVIQTLKDTESKIDTKLETIKDDTIKSKDIVVESVKDAKDKIEEKMEVAKDYVEETSQEKKKEAAKAKDSVFGFFKKGKDKTKEFVDDAKVVLVKSKDSAVDAGKKSKEASKKIVEDKKEDAVKAKDSVFGFFKKGKDAAKDFVEEKAGDATELKDTATQEIQSEKEKVKDFIKDKVDSAKYKAEKGKATAEDKIETAKDETIKIKDESLKTIDKTKETIITSTKDVLHEISDKTKSALSDGMQSGEELKTETKDKIQETLIDTNAAIEDKVESIKDGAIETKADVIQTLKDTESKIDTKLETIKDDTIKSKDIVVESVKDAKDKIEEKMEVAKDYVEETSQEKKKEAAKAKDSVFGFFKKGKDKTKEFVDDAKVELVKSKDSAVDAGKKSKEASKKIVEEKKDDAIKIKDSVFGFFKKGKDVAKDFVDEKAEDATKIEESVSHEIHTEKENVKQAFETAKQQAEKGKTAAEDKIEFVKDVIKDTHKDTIQIKDDTLEAIDKCKKATEDKTKEVLDKSKQKISETADQVTTSVADSKQAIDAHLESAKYTLVETKESALEKLVEAKESAKEFADTKIEEAEATKEKLIDSIQATKEKVDNKFISLTDRTDELASSVKDTTEKMVEEKKEEAAKAKDSVFGFLKKSKGKSIEVAEQTVTAVADASKEVKETSKQVAEATKDEAVKAKDSVFGFFKKGKSKAKEIADQGKDSAQECAKATEDKISASAKSAKEETFEFLESMKETAIKVTDSASDSVKATEEKIATKTDSAMEATIEFLEHSKDEASKAKDSVVEKSIKGKNIIQDKISGTAATIKDSSKDFLTKIKDEATVAKEQIADSSKKVGDSAIEKIEKTVDFVDKTKDSARSSMDSVQQNIMSGKAAIEEKALNMKDDIIETADKLKDKSHEKVESIKDSSTEILQKSKIESKVLIDKQIEKGERKLEDVEEKVIKAEKLVVESVESKAIDLIKSKDSLVEKLTDFKDELKGDKVIVDDAVDSEIVLKDSEVIKFAKECVIESVGEGSKDDEGGAKKKPMFRIESEDDSMTGVKGDDVKVEEKVEALVTDLDYPTVFETERIESKLEEIEKAIESIEKADKIECKLKRVERKFERMASDAMDQEKEEAKESNMTTPEMEERRESSFRTIVSQLSTEDVSDLQREYAALWDEQTFSQTDEWDSKTPESQADVVDLPQGEIVYMGPVNLNKDNLVNKAGIEVDVIPRMRSPYASPKPRRKKGSKKRAKSELGFHRKTLEEDRGSLPDLYDKRGTIMDVIMTMSPQRFLSKSTEGRSLVSLSYHTREDMSRSLGSSESLISRGHIMEAVVHWLNRSGSIEGMNQSLTDRSNLSIFGDDESLESSFLSERNSSRTENVIPDIFISEDEALLIYKESPVTITMDPNEPPTLEIGSVPLTKTSAEITALPQPKPRSNKTSETQHELTTASSTSTSSSTTIDAKVAKDETLPSQLEEEDRAEETLEESVIESYSERKKFWESVSSSSSQSQESTVKKRMSLYEEGTKSKITPMKRTSIHEVSSQPPVPKPRSIAAQSFSESKDEEVPSKPLTEYQSSFKDPAQVSPPKPDEPKELESADSIDSDNDNSAHMNTSSGYENTGYISDSGDVEHYISDSEIEDRVPQIRDRQMSVFQPSSSTRKSIYERSCSLPTEDLYEVSAKSMLLRKQYYEERIKKDMVEDDFMMEIEEEPLPEHKTLSIDDQSEEDDAEPSGVKSVPDTITYEKDELIETAVAFDEKAEALILDDDYEVVQKSVKDLTKAFETKSGSIIMGKSHKFEEVHDIKNFEEMVSEENISIFKVHKPQRIQQSSTESDSIFDRDSDENASKTGDSLEVHVDKSEIEDSEKMTDVDETKSLESTELSPKSLYAQEDIPEITISLSGKQRRISEESSEGSFEKPIDIKPIPEATSPINQPEEHVQDTIWEVSVESQVQTFDERALELNLEKGELIVEEHDASELEEEVKESVIHEEKPVTHVSETAISVEEKLIIEAQETGEVIKEVVAQVSEISKETNLEEQKDNLEDTPESLHHEEIVEVIREEKPFDLKTAIELKDSQQVEESHYHKEIIEQIQVETIEDSVVIEPADIQLTEEVSLHEAEKLSEEQPTVKEIKDIQLTEKLSIHEEESLSEEQPAVTKTKDTQLIEKQSTDEEEKLSEEQPAVTKIKDTQLIEKQSTDEEEKLSEEQPAVTKIKDTQLIEKQSTDEEEKLSEEQPAIIESKETLKDVQTIEALSLYDEEKLFEQQPAMETKDTQLTKEYSLHEEENILEEQTTVESLQDTQLTEESSEKLFEEQSALMETVQDTQFTDETISEEQTPIETLPDIQLTEELSLCKEEKISEHQPATMETKETLQDILLTEESSLQEEIVSQIQEESSPDTESDEIEIKSHKIIEEKITTSKMTSYGEKLEEPRAPLTVANIEDELMDEPEITSMMTKLEDTYSDEPKNTLIITTFEDDLMEDQEVTEIEDKLVEEPEMTGVISTKLDEEIIEELDYSSDEDQVATETTVMKEPEVTSPVTKFEDTLFEELIITSTVTALEKKVIDVSEESGISKIDIPKERAVTTHTDETTLVEDQKDTDIKITEAEKSIFDTTKISSHENVEITKETELPVNEIIDSEDIITKDIPIADLQAFEIDKEFVEKKSEPEIFDEVEKETLVTKTESLTTESIQEDTIESIAKEIPSKHKSLFEEMAEKTISEQDSISERKDEQFTSKINEFEKVDYEPTIFSEDRELIQTSTIKETISEDTDEHFTIKEELIFESKTPISSVNYEEAVPELPSVEKVSEVETKMTEEEITDFVAEDTKTDDNIVKKETTVEDKVDFEIYDKEVCEDSFEKSEVLYNLMQDQATSVISDYILKDDLSEGYEKEDLEKKITETATEIKMKLDTTVEDERDFEIYNQELTEDVLVTTSTDQLIIEPTIDATTTEIKTEDLHPEKVSYRNIDFASQDEEIKSTSTDLDFDEIKQSVSDIIDETIDTISKADAEKHTKETKIIPDEDDIREIKKSVTEVIDAAVDTVSKQITETVEIKESFEERTVVHEKSMDVEEESSKSETDIDTKLSKFEQYEKQIIEELMHKEKFESDSEMTDSTVESMKDKRKDLKSTEGLSMSSERDLLLETIQSKESSISDESTKASREIPVDETPTTSRYETEKIEVAVFEKDDDLSSSVRDESDLGSEIHQDHSESYCSDRRSDSQADIEKLILESLHHQKISPEEARIIANELIADIEAEIHRRHSTDYEEPPAPEYAKNQVSDYLRQLAETKGLDSRELQLVQSVLDRKQRELSKLSRADTQASSMEITDEDLKYSGTDYSPTGSRANILEEQIDQLEAERIDGDLNEELVKEVIDESRYRESSMTKDFEVVDDDRRVFVKTDLDTTCAETVKGEKVTKERKDIILEEDETILDSTFSESKVLASTSEMTAQQQEFIETNDFVCSSTSAAQIADEAIHSSETTTHVISSISEDKVKAESVTETAAKDREEIKGVYESESISKSVLDGETVDKTVNEVRKIDGIVEKDFQQTVEQLEESSVADDVETNITKQTTHTKAVTKNTVVDVSQQKTHTISSNVIVGEISQAELGELFQSGQFTLESSQPKIEEYREIIRTSSSESKSSLEGKSPEDISGERKFEERVVFRKTRTVDESSSSSSNLKQERKSGIDFEAYSSSGESHYQSFEIDSTKSRPCSSDVEGLLAAGSSEYESALTSQDISVPSNLTSTEYHTAVSSLSSKESMKSLDSESSGHLASVEVSEASETLVPSEFELAAEELMEGDFEYGKPLLSTRQSTEGSDSEVLPIDNQQSLDISEEDFSNDGTNIIETASKMKRSQEMTFQPEPKSLVPDSPQFESEERLGTSLDEGSVLSVSLSSTSSLAAQRTVIELSHTESERPGTGMTVSLTSDQLSLNEDIDIRDGEHTPSLVEMSTSTPYHPQDILIDNVTLTTSMIDENGMQCASTQVISQTHTPDAERSTVEDFSEKSAEIPEVKKRGHRRTESTSFTPGMISQITGTHIEQIEQKIHSDLPESDTYMHKLSFKEGKSDEKKDVDEKAEFYDTEADEGFLKDIEDEYKEDTPEMTSEVLDLEEESLSEDMVEAKRLIKEVAVEKLTHKEALDKRDSHGKSSSTSSEKSSFEEAEADAAFHMVAHVSPAHKIKQICPILEDEDAEKHELETRERAQKEFEQRRAQLRDQSPGAIPDIKVTQHMTPMDRKGFHYPDLELEEKEDEAQISTPQTPASNSSKSSESTDQGGEYILDQMEGVIAEESESQLLEDKTAESDMIETVVEKLCFEADKETDKETGSPMSESPNSDSFELLEKPDLMDEFVVIEEVAKEAHETDMEGKSVSISKHKIKKKHDEEVEEYLVKSAPSPSTKMTEIKYYPDGSSSDELGFEFEDSPPTNNQKSTGSSTKSPRDYVYEYDRELEANKKWIEQQFQGDQAAMIAAGYGYEMEFERCPLEDIKEEDIADFDQSRIGSLNSQKESGGSLGSVKDSYSSTPEYDVLAGRKYFTKSGEHDDISMSSLQEFESLERAMSLENRRFHQGSQDSLSNGSSFKTRYFGRSGQGDDVSVSSLKEFEGLEMACIAAHKVEVKVKEEELLLAQIDEGQESIASETESCETVSGPEKKIVADSDEEEYEKRMFEIDEIIRQAQTNVERFIDLKEGDKTESIGRGDSIEEVSKVPDLDLDAPIVKTQKVQWGDDDMMQASTDSLDIKEKPSCHGSTDSLDMKTPMDAMTTSTDSIELQAQKSKGTIMTDSIEIKDRGCAITSSDSLELATGNIAGFSDSIDEDGSRIGGHDHSSSSTGKDFSSHKDDETADQNKDFMLESTDSIASTSTATHATYQYETDSVYSGSFTSGGSNTMVSSTDNIDPMSRDSVNISEAVKKVWFGDDYDEADDSKPYVTEVIEPGETKVKRYTFKGADAEQQMRQFIDDFDEGEDVYEEQIVDEDGNVRIKRTVNKRIIIRDDGSTTELMRESVLKRSFSDERTRQSVAEDPAGEASGSSWQQTAGASSSGSAQNKVQTARRRPLPLEISLDDQSMIEVDPREHDWRFNLPHYEKDEARAATPPEHSQFYDQHQLSDEMKELLREMEKESKK